MRLRLRGRRQAMSGMWQPSSRPTEGTDILCVSTTSNPTYPFRPCYSTWPRWSCRPAPPFMTAENIGKKSGPATSIDPFQTMARAASLTWRRSWKAWLRRDGGKDPGMGRAHFSVLAQAKLLEATVADHHLITVDELRAAGALDVPAS